MPRVEDAVCGGRAQIPALHGRMAVVARVVARVLTHHRLLLRTCSPHLLGVHLELCPVPCNSWRRLQELGGADSSTSHPRHGGPCSWLRSQPALLTRLQARPAPLLQHKAGRLGALRSVLKPLGVLDKRRELLLQQATHQLGIESCHAGWSVGCTRAASMSCADQHGVRTSL